MKKIYIILWSVLVLTGCSTQKTETASAKVKENIKTSVLDRSVMPKPGPAPKVNVLKPKEFKLDNGLTVLVVEDHKLPRVSLSLDIDNPLKSYGDKKGVRNLLSSTLGNGTVDMTKDEFNGEIEFMGATVSISAGGAWASSLTRFFPRILELTAKGALSPRFDRNEFEKEKEKMLQDLKANEKNVSTVANNIKSYLTFGAEHPFGEFITSETVNSVNFEDIQKEYKSTFSPENAYLVVIGDVTFNEVKNMVQKEFSQWENFSVEEIHYTNPTNLQQTEIDFVNMPNAVQTELYVTNVTNLKMTDPDYFSVLMANQILGGGGEGRLFQNLREAHGWTYGSYSSIGADKYISSFTAQASVRNAVTDSAIVELRNELKRIRVDNVTKDELEMAKAKYIGNFVMEVQKPQVIAILALRTKTQHLSNDFYENFIKGIESVTVEEIKKAANKYFKYDNSRIIVVGKATDVLPALQKLNYPIRYYDRDGNETEDPLKSTGNLGDMTAEKVLTAYINSIGGEAIVKRLASTKMKFEINGVAPTPIQGVLINKAPNKQKMVMMMNGNVVMSTIFDGEKEMSEGMMGSNERTGEEVADQKARKGIIPQAFYAADQAALKGVEQVNEKEAYKIEVILGGKTKTEYYDKATHFLLRSQEVTETPQGPLIVQVDYKDYKEVDGIKFPFTMIQNVGPQTMKLEIKSIEVNKDVTDGDFQ